MTAKPDWWIELEARFAKIGRAALPPEPWTLHRTPAGNATPTGGVFTTVINNEAYLERLRADLALGPSGPRGRVVLGDLAEFRGVLDAWNQS